MNVKKILIGFKKHSPEILTGCGIGGMIITTIMAVRATPKALILIKDKRKELNKDELTVKETIVTAGTCYVPAAITGTISIFCLIGASSVNVRRRAALATAYTVSESVLKEYQEKVIEAVGKKKEQAIRDAVAKEAIVKNPTNDCKVIITEKGDTLCFDAISGRYFKSDIEKIRKAENELNRRMRDEMYIPLNDFYYEIGLDGIGIGDELGWNINNGYIELEFSSQLDTNGTPCLVIGYLVEPRYDYHKL